jgi:hypothetical protein
MNKHDLANTLANCPKGLPLFSVAAQAARQLNASESVRVVVGEPQPCVDLLRIYSARLKRKHEQDERVVGLEETVQAFEVCTGHLKGGYAETDGGLIYFWTDDAGKIAGCILQTN